MQFSYTFLVKVFMPRKYTNINRAYKKITVKKKMEMALEEWQHVCVSQSTTNSRLWGEFGWKNLTR